MTSPLNELTIRSMTIEELERSSHLLADVSGELLLDIFIQKFNSLQIDLDDERSAADTHECELIEAQDALEDAERDLAIAESKVTELEDMINTNESVITQLNNALIESESKVTDLENQLSYTDRRPSYCDM